MSDAHAGPHLLALSHTPSEFEAWERESQKQLEEQPPLPGVAPSGFWQEGPRGAAVAVAVWVTVVVVVDNVIVVVVKVTERVPVEVIDCVDVGVVVLARSDIVRGLDRNLLTL